MKKSRPTIKLSKLDVAKRQLETAIHLYFLERDPVSIHTLVAASYQIIQDLNKHRNGRPMLFEDLIDIYIKDGHKKEVYKKLHEAENFFKHADKDPDEVIEFSPLASESILWEACIKYTELSGEQTSRMQAMNGWFQLKHPDLFKYDDWRKKVLAENQSFIKTITKTLFYREFMKSRLEE